MSYCEQITLNIPTLAQVEKHLDLAVPSSAALASSRLQSAGHLEVSVR
ncbi:hypothetical protein [Pseudomonas putida]|nr:hypothetical protein [Pseudomonas putida]